MIFVKYKKLTETKARIELIHYQPEDLPEDMLKTGILVESIPEPEYIEGKISHLYYNPQEKKFFYEYTDSEETKEERLQKQLKLQQEQIDILALSVLELKGGM